MKRLSLPLLALFLIACPPTIRQVGLQMVEQGHYPQAVDYWLDAYADSEDQDARALADAMLYAQDACAHLQDVAIEHEAEQRYEQSQQTYQELQAFSQRIVEHGLPPCMDVQHELEDVEGALAQERYVQAQRWLEFEQWDKAIGDLQLCRALRPGFKDSGELMAAAWRGWAAQDLAEGRYQAAIDHYDQAWEIGGLDDDHLWSGAIHAALGRDYLAKGACRLAVEELRQAMYLEFDRNLDVDLARARSCARVDLIVLPVEDFTAEEEGGTIAFGAVFRDQLEANLCDTATEHVRLLDPDSVQVKRLSDPAVLLQQAGRVYHVRGRITQAVTEEPEPITAERKATAIKRLLCDKKGTFDTAGEDWCEKKEIIRYDQTTRSRTVRLTGSVRVVAAHSGEQVLTAPIAVDIRREVNTTEGFTLVGEPVEVAAEPDVGVLGIEPELLALLQEPEPLPSPAELRVQAVQELGVLAATEILGQIDKPMDVPPARRLKVQAPITTAGQLEFGRGEVEVDQPEDPPPPEEPEEEEDRPVRVQVIRDQPE